ncbi:hypothetical protein [Paenibacillus sp. 32O-W]|uniref:hypothetical protein n=1 Tax=Paenibacillus sp. 32O-W TaxID=1695218 RepID=UPI0011A70700|nr:hypothetical protein [Paenibacillus sp. 32O-W]
MYPFIRRVALVGLACAAAAALTACQSGGKEAQPAPSPSTMNDKLNESQPAPSPFESREGAPVNGTPVFVPQEGEPPSGTAQSMTPDRNKPEIEAYSSERPLLMGLSISDSRQTVLDKFGEPDNEFVMDDPTDPITVLDYSDFTVGINRSDKVEFVSIDSIDIDPGLNGLKLGQKAADAIKALGEPDTTTNYVMAYSNEATVLRLDIDSKTGKIQSIKLFDDAQKQ